MPSPADAQVATLDKFLAAWQKGSAAETIALWSDDFTQRLLPLSLGRPALTRAQASAALSMMMGKLTNWKTEIRQVVHDSARGSAAVYTTAVADTPLPGGEVWNNEYGVFITFSHDGTKITKIEEMIDTAFFGEFFPKFQRYLAEQPAQQGV
ncbi:hypothetical protein B0H67DRAFT_638157 [Lasiosphaeris hirsuta]|uniref:SnoaL-like domain-containing protein n=1 Tax=Lasiosphaeris hirsuta TaxID=260670 RepID=A0AA40B8D8_9PEZI|nr:hypothetical protein B0H67DRAFT_638157 [Lasiosphaeris hirsuta]